LPDEMPNKINPIWLMDVYAINRFILTCLIAPTEPINIEPIAETLIII
jgi:hypothetical protein